MTVSQSANRHYYVFGLTLSSDFDFKIPLLPAQPGQSQCDVTFTCSSTRPDKLNPDASEKLFDSSATKLKIYKNQNWQIFDYPEHTCFFLKHNHIHCQLKDNEFKYLVDIRLFGFVMSYWLTLYKHDAMIHSSAIANESGSALFIATNAGGKTSLAAAMIQSGNYALLSDDIVRISNHGNQLMCYPSYPQIRLWPQQVSQLLNENPAHFPRVHPEFEKCKIQLPHPTLGKFQDRENHPAVIYQPVRNKSAKEVCFKPLSAKKAFMLLRQNLFIRDLLTSKDLQTNSLQLLAQIANTVPAYELGYPEGFEHLPMVCKQINEHILRNATS